MSLGSPSLSMIVEDKNTNIPHSARPLSTKTQFLKAPDWELKGYDNDFNFFHLLFWSPKLKMYRFINRGQDNVNKKIIKDIKQGTNLYEEIHTPITTGGKPVLNNNVLTIKSKTDMIFIDLAKSSDTDAFMWKVNRNLLNFSISHGDTDDFIYIIDNNEENEREYHYGDLTHKSPFFTFSSLPYTPDNKLPGLKAINSYPYYVFSHLTQNNDAQLILFDKISRETRVLEKNDYLLETLDDAVTRRVLLENGSTVLFDGSPLTFLCRKQYGILSCNQEEARYIRWNVKCLNENEIDHSINQALSLYLTSFFSEQYKELLLPRAIKEWNPGTEDSFQKERLDECLLKLSNLDIISDTYPLDISFSYKDDKFNVKSTYAINSIGKFEVNNDFSISLEGMYSFKNGVQIENTYDLSGGVESNFPNFKLYSHIFNNFDLPTWRIQTPLYNSGTHHLLKSGKIPTVLYLGGGPYSVKNDPFDAHFRFLSDQGFAVFVPSYPGSTHTINSFLKTKGQCIELTNSYLEFLVNILKTDSSLDTDNIAIVGSSYGGMIALQHAVGNCNLKNIRAAVSFSGATSFLSRNDENRDDKDRDGLNEYLFAGDKDRETTMSPIHYAANLKVPTLIIQGKDDPRVTYKEVEEFVNCAKTHNPEVPLTFLSIAHTGHAISTQEQFDSYKMIVTQFLRHHLNYTDGLGAESHRETMKHFDSTLINGFGCIEFGRKNLGL